MNSDHDIFSPETVDEQIEHLARIQNVPNSVSSDAQLVHALQRVTREDAQRLARIRQRLAARTMVGQQETQQLPIAGNHYPHVTPPPNMRQPRRRVHRLTLVLSGLAAALLLVVMVAVFLQLKLHFNATPVRPVPKIQVTPTATMSTVAAPAGFYTSLGQSVFRLDQKSGHILWQYSIANAQGSQFPLKVAGDAVYVMGTTDVYALDAAKGTLRWSHSFGQPQPIDQGSRQIQSIAFDGGFVYVLLKTQVVALHAPDGKVVHTYQARVHTPLSEMAVAGNVLYVTGVFDLEAISVVNGQELWYKAVAAPQNDLLLNLQATPSFVTLRVAHQLRDAQGRPTGGTGTILAFDVQTGTRLWQSQTVSNEAYYFTAAMDAIYYGTSKNGVLHAYNVKTGKELWQRDIGALIGGEPQVDGTIICIRVNARANTDYPAAGIVALERATGAIAWYYPGTIQQMRQGTQIYDEPTIQQGIIYVNVSQNAFSRSEIYAITLRGKVLWHSDINVNVNGNG